MEDVPQRKKKRQKIYIVQHKNANTRRKIKEKTEKAFIFFRLQTKFFSSLQIKCIGASLLRELFRLTEERKLN